jgi:hypothetical protein
VYFRGDVGKQKHVWRERNFSNEKKKKDLVNWLTRISETVVLFKSFAKKKRWLTFKPREWLLLTNWRVGLVVHEIVASPCEHVQHVTSWAYAVCRRHLHQQVHHRCSEIHQKGIQYLTITCNTSNLIGPKEVILFDIHRHMFIKIWILTAILEVVWSFANTIFKNTEFQFNVSLSNRLKIVMTTCWLLINLFLFYYERE